jgi:selenocysteine lyase/cysteine desulfurase
VPLAIARDRYGLIVRRIALPVGPTVTAAEIATRFANEIDAARAAGQRVRALMWSSPTFLTGMILPIRRIVDVAIQKSTPADPIITVCDGAHLPGMMAYNYAELGVDFMAGAAHKWQCAAGSTGILIIRNRCARSSTAAAAGVLPDRQQRAVGHRHDGTATQAAVVDGRQPNAPKLLVGTVPWSSRAGSTAATAPFDVGSVVQQLAASTFRWCRRSLVLRRLVWRLA